MEEAVSLPLERAHVPAWAWFVVTAALAVVYLLTMENGAVLAQGAGTVHELFHDARHFLAVPCH
jgi:hypothetical protein